MVLAPLGRLHGVQMIDVELDMLATAGKPLRSRARVRVHIGASEVLGRVLILNAAGVIEPGSKGFAQLRLESAIVTVPDERFIIRSYSPSVTIAGGRILDPFAHKHRRKEMASVQEHLQKLLDGDHSSRLVQYIASSAEVGLRLSDIAGRTGWNDETLAQASLKAIERSELVQLEEILIARQGFDHLCEMAVAAVAKHHKQEPLSRGLARETLREQHFGHTAPEVFRAVIARLEEEGKLVADKELIRAREHNLELSDSEINLRDRMAAIYEGAKLEPPTLDETLTQANVAVRDRTHAKKVLQLLIDAGTLIRVQGDLLFHRLSLDELVNKLQAYAAAHEPERVIDVATFKDLAGVSRKYAIPLLEYFDRTRVTTRYGDRRIIRG